MANPFFLAGQPVSLGTTSGDAATAPVAFLTRDEPTLAWRSSGLSNVYLTFTTSSAIDTIALLFSNLRASDTIRVRAASTSDNVTASPDYDSKAVAAYTGNKAGIYRTKTILTLPSAVAGPYWRIDIQAPSHPDGYVTAARLLAGNRIELPVDWGAKQGINDPSMQTSGAGWTDTQAFPTLPTWEWTNSWISDSAWNDAVQPFLMTVGIKTPFLFVPDVTSNRVQQQACWGRLNSNVLSGQSSATDMWAVTMAMTGLTS